MDFAKRIGAAHRESIFNPDPQHIYVWCGTCVHGGDGRYYLYYSFWPRELGFSGWVIRSQIGVAAGDSPTGPFEPVGMAVPASGRGWDADCTHNPTAHIFDGRYYIYYMGNHGNGEYWNHRNNQRIGVAVSDSPTGPFERFDAPLIDVTPGSCDALMTSNPSVARMADGRYIMVYKAVGLTGALPQGGPVVCAVAFADSPIGPFVKCPDPIFSNPEHSWSVEDPFIWRENGRLYALVKDFQGYFTHSARNCVALFESDDGVNWRAGDAPLAFERTIRWDDGKAQQVHNLERPQLLIEGGVPIALYCACAPYDDYRESFNISFAITG